MPATISSFDAHFDGQKGCWNIAALYQSKTHLMFDVSIATGVDTGADAWCECWQLKSLYSFILESNRP